MKHKLSFLFAIISCFAVITQYILMVQNRTTGIVETSIRFVSFFTILTNTLVALYFILLLLETKHSAFIKRSGTLTALTLYITVVGLVYQFLLRGLWHPTGMQRVIDELLHSLIPLVVIVFWFLYEDKKGLNYSLIPKWLIYPLGYLSYILLRGYFSDFYPYPFVNVTALGMQQVLFNSVLLTMVFIVFSFLFIFAGKLLAKQKPT